MAERLLDKNGKPIIREGEEVYTSFSADGVQMLKAVSVKDRTLHIIGTDETRDRQGDIIKVKGWELDNFRKNPVFLWAHDYNSVPIAVADKITVRKKPLRMEFREIFPTEGLYPFADMILALYGEKIINASSVGFIPKKWEEIEEEDEEKDLWRNPRRFLEQELLELSGCAVPANPNALQSDSVKSMKFGGVSVEECFPWIMGNKDLPSPDTKDDILEEFFKVAKEIKIEDETIQKSVIVGIDLKKEEDEEKEGDEEKEEDEEKDEVLDTAVTRQPLKRRQKVEPEEEQKESEEDFIDADELKPYPNEHACRLNDPDKYDKYGNQNREHDGKKYRVIRGRKKGTTDEWEDQAFRYKKDVWTAGNAKTHCKDHDGSFEAAEESVQMESVESKEKEISPMSLAEEPKKDLVGNVYKEILDPSKSKPQIDKEQETESGKKALDLAGMNETYEKAVKELRKAFEELMKVIRRFKL